MENRDTSDLPPTHTDTQSQPAFHNTQQQEPSEQQLDDDGELAKRHHCLPEQAKQTRREETAASVLTFKSRNICLFTFRRSLASISICERWCKDASKKHHKARQSIPNPEKQQDICASSQGTLHNSFIHKYRGFARDVGNRGIFPDTFAISSILSWEMFANAPSSLYSPSITHHRCTDPPSQPASKRVRRPQQRQHQVTTTWTKKKGKTDSPIQSIHRYLATVARLHLLFYPTFLSCLLHFISFTLCYVALHYVATSWIYLHGMN